MTNGSPISLLWTMPNKNSLAVFGTDLPAGIRRRITRMGISKLSPVEQRLIVDTGFHNDAYRTLMQEGFVESHCGLE